MQVKGVGMSVVTRGSRCPSTGCWGGRGWQQQQGRHRAAATEKRSALLARHTKLVHPSNGGQMYVKTRRQRAPLTA